jgi:hypothetical protein
VTGGCFAGDPFSSSSCRVTVDDVTVLVQQVKLKLNVKICGLALFRPSRLMEMSDECVPDREEEHIQELNDKANTATTTAEQQRVIHDLMGWG